MPNIAAQSWTQAFIDSFEPITLCAGYDQQRANWHAELDDTTSKCFHFWFISKGSGAVKIDETWHEFKAGELITIKPGQNYQAERTGSSQGSSIYYTLMSPFGKAKAALDRKFAQVLDTRMRCVNKEIVLNVFRTLHEAFVLNAKTGSLLLKGLSLQLLYEIITQTAPALDKPHVPGYRKYEQARRILDTSYTEMWTCDSLAGEVGISSSYLSKLFHMYAGQPPIEYLVNRRIEQAKWLLTTGTAVTATASLAGFNSVHYFSRMFKNRTGVSPSEYAAAHHRQSSPTARSRK